MPSIYSNNPFVTEASTLDLVGAYVACVRDRFRNNPAEFPWKWDSDSNLARIFIDAGAVDTYEQRDSRPSILIDRSSVVYQKLHIGDRADFSPTLGYHDYHCLGAGQISVDCVSKNRGESSLLGDIVATHLLMSKDVFRAILPIRDMTPITLGNTQPWEKDDRVFVSRVTSEFTFDLSWRVEPLTTRLDRIKMLITPESSTT
jgi:hypothetical protein